MPSHGGWMASPPELLPALTRAEDVDLMGGINPARVEATYGDRRRPAGGPALADASAHTDAVMLARPSSTA